MYFGKFFVNSRFQPTKYLLSTYYVQSTLLGTRDTVASDTVKCPCGCGADVLEESDQPPTKEQEIIREWMATLKKTKWSNSVQGPREHHHTGCPHTWVLPGHNRSQCEKTKRNSITVPPLGSTSMFCLWNTHKWTLGMWSPNQPSKHKWVNNTQQHSLLILLFIYFNTKLWH